MNNLLFTLVALLLSGFSFAQQSSCIGKWVTVDDITQQKKSIVELYKYNGQLFGNIIHLYPKKGRSDNPNCDLCTDDRKGKPFVGMQIVRNLKWDGTAWSGGTVCDPGSGKVYKTKIWLNEDDPNKLNARGYLGPFFRTQTWLRVVD